MEGDINPLSGLFVLHPSEYYIIAVHLTWHNER
jgi:hypothetical protein